MKILLVCAAGMSTSLLVTKMRTAAKENGIEVQIDAMPLSTAAEAISKSDVVLLGPQVRSFLGEVEQITQGKIPIGVCDMKAYGTMNGELVLQQALDLINESKK